MHLTTTFCVPCGSAPLGTFDAMNVYSLYFSIPIFFLARRLTSSTLQSSLSFQGSCLLPYYKVHFPFRAPDSVHATEFTFLSGLLSPSILQSSLSFQGACLRPCYRVHLPFRAPVSVHTTEFTFLSGLLSPSILQSSLSFQGA